jgi:hypothetical protein
VPAKRTGPRLKDLVLEIPAPFAPVVAAFTKQPAVVLEPGWGKGNLTLKLGTKIFVLLMADSLVAKLPKARVDALVEEGRGTRFDPRKNGRVMKEWLVIGARKDWLPLAREAHAFIVAAR